MLNNEGMIKRSEAYFQGYLDATLYYQRWSPARSEGTLLITHGHGEHGDCYQRVVDAVLSAGWTVLAWDWRGHGRSDGLRGYAEHFSDYANDFEIWYQLLQPELLDSKKPVVLLGHSMGGLIQLKSVLAHPEWQISAQVLCNPLLGVQLEVPAYKQIGAEWLSTLLPKVTMSNEVRDEDLTRDRDILQEFTRDSLRHDRISSRVYLGSIECMAQVHERVDRMRVPTLLQLSPGDQVVSPSESRRFFEKITAPKKLIEYADSKHEIYNDLDRAKAFEDLKAYLETFKK